LKKAVDLLRLPDARMMKMTAPDGASYFIVPGGRLHDGDAEKILKRIDLIAFEDGLFPGNSQCWRLG
jgi:hypothetical protein